MLNTNSPFLDNLIYAGIILLVLSQITEKVTTFIRNYLRISEAISNNIQRKKRLSYFLSKYVIRLLKFLLILDEEQDIYRDEINRKKNIEGKTEVEFGITKLSILVGTFIALTFNANLFDIIGNSDPNEIFNFKYDLNFCNPFNCDCLLNTPGVLWLMIKYTFGCLCTGFLLSFGSKFFHDLLEILFEIKRLRRNLADKEYLVNSNNTEEVQQKLNSLGEPTKLVIERHQDILFHKFDNIISLKRVFENEKNAILEIRIKDNNDVGIKGYKFTYFDGKNEQTLDNSKIKIIPNCDIVFTHNHELEENMPVFPYRNKDDFGTLGFFALQNNEVYFVTCGHVVDPEEKNDNAIGNTIYVDINNKKAGEISVSVMNSLMDIGIVKINNQKDYQRYKKIKHFVLDTYQKFSIEVDGAKSDKMIGEIYSLSNTVKITYPNNEDRILYDLISLTKNCNDNEDNRKSVSNSGDSGAIVFCNNKPYAMIIAGNNSYSYAIPISKILSWYDLEIITY